MSTKRTYKPSRVRKARKYGYRSRMSKKTGRKVIRKRIKRGRKRITI